VFLALKTQVAKSVADHYFRFPVPRFCKVLPGSCPELFDMPGQVFNFRQGLEPFLAGKALFPGGSHAGGA
jgi:hypothetical protein